MSVYIESVLQYEDVRLVLEGAAESGVVRRTQLTELIETHELDPLETEALYREFDQRNVEINEDERADAEPAPPPPPAAPIQTSFETTTDALQLFLREADRAWRHGSEAADDPVEPPPRRLDRQELPQSGPSVPRPDPGGDARPDPRCREVRLAARLQVLDVRDVVDPPGRRPRARRQGADDPDARSHRRAAPENEQGRAHPLDAARTRAVAGGDRRGGQSSHRAGARGARRGTCVDESRPAGRRGGGRRVRRLPRRRRPASRGPGRDQPALPGAVARALRARRPRAPGDHPPLRARRPRAEDARGDRPQARAHARAGASD